MATSDEHLAHAVDEALDPVWPFERRLALRRWRLATAARVAIAMAALWGLGLGMRIVVGMALPWTFFAFIGAMMTLAAFHQEEGREHLREEREEREE
jgi:hypothetical protein